MGEKIITLFIGVLLGVLIGGLYWQGEYIKLYHQHQSSIDLLELYVKAE